MQQGYIQTLIFMILTSDKKMLGITGEYKQQSSCAFTWCVKNTVESQKKEVQKEKTEDTAA